MQLPTSLARRSFSAGALACFATVASAAAFASSLAAQPVDEGSAAAQPVDEPRVRFGVSGVGGGFAGTIHGALGGLSPRLGLQIDDHAAVFLQAQGLIGQFLLAPGGDGTAGFAFHTLMLEFTLADLLQLGVGPSLDFVWGCDARYQQECVSGGPYFGTDMRLAVVVGNRGPGQRTGVAFSFDLHPTFFGNAAAAVFLFGVGLELY